MTDVQRIEKPKKRKTTKAQSLTKQADILFSLIVRSPGRCAACGATRDLQCAHGFSRAYRSVRWTEANAWCLCKGCHMKYTHRPIEWDEWMKTRLGKQGYERLRRKALIGAKVDMKALVEHLKVRHRQLYSQGVY